jgi:hypothetical protein
LLLQAGQTGFLAFIVLIKTHTHNFYKKNLHLFSRLGLAYFVLLFAKLVNRKGVSVILRVSSASVRADEYHDLNRNGVCVLKFEQRENVFAPTKVQARIIIENPVALTDFHRQSGLPNEKVVALRRERKGLTGGNGERERV